MHNTFTDGRIFFKSYRYPIIILVEKKKKSQFSLSFLLHGCRQPTSVTVKSHCLRLSSGETLIKQFTCRNTKQMGG